MTPANARPGHRESVAAWQEHLREGGTTPWAEFAPTTVEVPHRLGSAVHLELVRRLDSSLPDFTSLADLVLATPTPGRGSVDIPVEGDPAPGPGAPPVDPTDLDAEELLRLATAVLAPLVMRTPTPAPAAPRTRPFARRFRVRGTPLVRAQLRAALLARGWRETRSGGTTFVVGAPLADAVAQVWTRRVEIGGTVTWSRLWRRFEAKGRLPSSLDFDGLVQQAQEAGGRVVRLHGTSAEVADLLRQQHGISIPGASDLVTVELVRRLNVVLSTRVPQRDRPGLAPAIAEVVGESATPLRSLAIPLARRAWAQASAERHSGSVADYAHQQDEDIPDRVPSERALELALLAIGRGWTRQRGREA